MRTTHLATAAALLLLTAGAASGSVMTTTLGDMDGFGWGLTQGQSLPVFPFNLRESDDPAFTDFGAAGETNATFTFAYSSFVGTINSATLVFGLSGMEDYRSDTPGAVYDDRLYLDTVEIAGAFDNDYTGIRKYGIVNLAIPSSLFSLLLDGTAGFFFDGWPAGTSGAPRPGDQVSFDYVTLEIDYSPPAATAPLPPSLAIASIGALLVSLTRLRRSRE
jgi:hypothetical protein